MSATHWLARTVFTQHPGPPAQGKHRDVGWSLPYQSLMKRMSYSFILLQHFHRGGSLLSDESRFCQVDKKLDSTEFIFFKILRL